MSLLITTVETFDKKLGFKVQERKKGFSRIKLQIKKWHLNHGGILHGGVTSTLCDSALADAVTNHMKKNQWCVTVQLNIKFIEPAYLGETIYGYGKLKRIGKTLAFVEGGVETENKRQIASADGIWFIKEGKSKKITTKQPIKKMD